MMLAYPGILGVNNCQDTSPFPRYRKWKWLIATRNNAYQHVSTAPIFKGNATSDKVTIMPALMPFGSAGQWFKGNLHTHSLRSDGRLSADDNIRWHADHGYDFIALTDHNKVSRRQDCNQEPPILLIPGVEISARRGHTEYHVVALGVDSMPIAPYSDPQDTIDAVNSQGGVCFIAHPYWHDHSFSDLLCLKGQFAIEIFNTGCWLEINKGHSLVHWDGLLSRGRLLHGLATDDSHFAYPDHGRGWINLKSEKLDQISVLKALQEGQFYSSMGPQIFEINQEGRELYVRCSPVRSIYLIGDLWHCPDARHSWNGDPITEAHFSLHQGQRYIRFEIIDHDHNSAWSNAFFMP